MPSPVIARRPPLPPAVTGSLGSLLRRSRVERYLQQSKRKVTLADPAVAAVHVEEAVEREQLREAAPATVGGDAGGGEQRGEGGEAQRSRV